MSSGTVNIRVRPLRIGFLVDPADKQGLYRAIEINTLLWGGSYNPIIPVYKHTPYKWEPHRVRNLITPSDIISGYLSGFDPDLVVPLGVCEKRTFDVGNRDIVKEDELIGDLTKSVSPNYGLGYIDILNDFIEKELKFKRNDDLYVLIPIISRNYKYFLASIFGVLPIEVQQMIEKDFSVISKIVTDQISLQKVPEIILSNSMFPRRLTTWELSDRIHDREILFLCDATSAQDIIDYWNLRAAGFLVIPIPIQASAKDNFINLARNFIEEHYYPIKDNPSIYHHITVQKSRSLSQDVVEKFCDSMNLDYEVNDQPKYMLRWWYPRLWDAWARENAYEENINFPYAYNDEINFSEGEDRLEFRTKEPRINTFQDYTGAPKYANEINFRFYDSKESMAEVFPEGSRELSSAIGRTAYYDWRFSKSGPVFLAKSNGDFVFLDLPRAESVMTEWFRERGWKVTLSGPGRIAKQLFNYIGGKYGISKLAHQGVIDLFACLEKEAGMHYEEVLAVLTKVVQTDKLLYSAEHLLENLINANGLRLGTKIQCPVCTRHNWYELNVLDYHLKCNYCLSDFTPPLCSPNGIKWAYKAHGPYSYSVSQGAFSVLLTLNFIKGDFDQGITPLFSYVAQKDGKTLEADLTCLYKHSTWHETGTFIIHAECKSYNKFERKDINRMKELAVAFPGSALIFATLKNELDESEIELIRKLAVEERKKMVNGKPNSPIILLTGTELFSDILHDKWGEKGGLFRELSKRRHELKNLQTLADVTQQLYLSLPSWFEYYEDERKKRKQRHKKMM